MAHMSTKLARSPRYGVSLAGLLLQVNSVFASDSIGDAQAQASALLDPPVAHHVIRVEPGGSDDSRGMAPPRRSSDGARTALGSLGRGPRRQDRGCPGLCRSGRKTEDSQNLPRVFRSAGGRASNDSRRRRAGCSSDSYLEAMTCIHLVRVRTVTVPIRR